MDVFEKLESNVRSYSRSFPVVFSKAKMSKMYTVDGREYLDFFNGAGALSYGHNNDYIKQKVLDYIANDGISHALDMFTGAKEEFFRTFDERILQPKGYNYKIMSCAPTGTNGVEAALKLSRKVTGRPGIFAFTGSFHGMSLGSLSVTSGKTVRRGAGAGMPDVTFVPHPCGFPGDAIQYIDNVITDEYSGVMKPAAIILETIQAEGGVRIMPAEFLIALRALCDRHGVLMIVDDIQVGCGRTGKFFSFEDAGVEPDLVVLSKSISGYGFPMSLLLLKPELDVFAPGEHNGTFRGNQVAFVGAKAGIELREKLGLEAATVSNDALIRRFVSERILPLGNLLEYRGKGMIHGIDFERYGDDTLSTRVARTCFDLGLIIERAGRNDCVLKIMPALTIEENELAQGLEIIEAAIKKQL
jgi:diaminobutyrate-2-oxoglutarate transaminase